MKNKQKQKIKILKILDEGYQESCFYFCYLMKKTHFKRNDVRTLCHLLAKEGLAQYERGLFDDEGMTAGSGYCITEKGHQKLEKNDN